VKHPQIAARLEHIYGFLVRLNFANVSDREAWLYRYNACSGGKIENNVFVIKDGTMKVDYTGRYVKRPAPKPEDFDALAAHAQRAVDVDLVRAYKVAPGVAYTVAYEAYHDDPKDPAGVLLVTSPTCTVKT
jgi:hypothetical protein